MEHTPVPAPAGPLPASPVVPRPAVPRTRSGNDVPGIRVTPPVPSMQVAVMYRAAAALPFDDRDRVTAGLRGQLSVMAAAAGAHPDWSTLRVEGPARGGEHQGTGLTEWAATVVVTGDGAVLDDRTLDTLLAATLRRSGAIAEETSPLM